MLARTKMAILLACVRIFQQSMRNTLSPLLVFMAAEVKFSTSQKGMLLSAVAAGYFFTQVPGGALADRFGAKNVMTICLILSACCIAAVPTAIEKFGVDGLWWTVALMGFVQGPLFPCSAVVLARWMPRQGPTGADEKAWGTSMLDIGVSLGSLAIIPVANSLAETLGWRNAFRGIGALSLGFTATWHVLASETPSRCWFISDDERAFLEKSIRVPPAAAKSSSSSSTAGTSRFSSVVGVPFSVATHPGVWAVFFSHAAFNNGAYYITYWSPTYYADVLKLPNSEAKYHLMLPFVANLALTVSVPLLMRFTQSRGVTLLSSRKLFTCVGFVGAALGVVFIAQQRTRSPWASTALFAIANSFFGLAPSGFKSNYLDITEAYVGILSGYGNTFATVASWAGPKMVAFLLERFQSWDLVFKYVACVNLLAAAYYFRYAVIHPVERALDEKVD